MSTYLTGSRRPLYIDAVGGPNFAVFHSPKGACTRKSVLYIPPFAEEMNRARHMASLQAESLSRAGIGTLILDLFGTGDSAGEFAQADWQRWIRDVHSGLDWLLNSGFESVVVLGLRMGALLAAVLASERSEIDRLVFWQPVMDGKSLITEFLRVRVAAGMSSGNGAANTMELRAELNETGSLEIGGYELSSSLAAKLEKLRLDQIELNSHLTVEWLEVGATDSEDVRPACARVVAKWRNQGNAVSTRTVKGDPFWATQEVTIAPALLDATLEILT